MSAAAPSPHNMLVLAALGIGAYWFFSRRAVAAPATAGGAQRPGTSSAGRVAGVAQWAANDQGLWSMIGKIIGPTTPAQTRTYQAANGANSGPVPVYGSEPGDPYSSGNYDMTPANPAPGIDWDAWWQNDTGDLGAYF